MLDTLHNTFAFLAKNPEAGTLRENLRPRLRILSPAMRAHNYVIFYYPRANGIEVITVIHVFAHVSCRRVEEK